MLELYLFSVFIVVGYAILGVSLNVFKYRTMWLGIVVAFIPLVNTVLAGFIVVAIVSIAVSKIRSA